MSVAVRAAAAAALAAALAGCGEANRTRVSGHVYYLDRPVRDGVVFFDPVPVANPSAPAGYAVVRDGRFDTADPGGSAAPSGWVTVRIEASDPPSEKHPDGKVLFPSYRSARVELAPGRAEIDFDVPLAAGQPAVSTVPASDRDF